MSTATNQAPNFPTNPDQLADAYFAQQNKLDRVKALVDAADRKFDEDPEFDRQYALEQLIANIQRVIR